MQLDHLVFAVPELVSGTAAVSEQLGVPATQGGRHEGRGTHNMLFGLGPQVYLEVIAADPDQQLTGPRPFAAESIRTPRLVAWAGRTQPGEKLEALAARAREAGTDLGQVVAMSRANPDGSRLAWRLTVRSDQNLGPLPFLVDWGTTTHPTRILTQPCRLLGLKVQVPDPAGYRRLLAAIGLADEVEVVAGVEPSLTAVIKTPRGTVELS